MAAMVVGTAFTVTGACQVRWTEADTSYDGRYFQLSNVAGQ